MSIKTPKRPRDPNQLAKMVVDLAIGENTEALITDSKAAPLVELGRAGGLKGGRARADKLSGSERSAIAKKAAGVRWSADKPKV